ncbi:hypothetical protein RUND412_003462 [Rhizina undulata]
MSESSNLDVQLEEYLSRRAALIAKEKELRHDYAFRQRLSPTAKRAAQIVKAIRKHEAETIWNKEADEGEDEIFPGMHFTLARPRMENTELWRIVKRLPKGALLHAHLEAMVDMDFLLNLILKTPGMYIISSEPLTTARALNSAAIGFTFIPVASSYSESIYSPSYRPDTPIPVSRAAESFPESYFATNDSSGDPQSRFFAWLQSRITITPEESLRQHEGINKIWRKFQGIFRVINGAIYYEPIFRQFVQHILSHVHQDNIYWIDMRVAFVMELKAAGSGEILPRKDVVRIFGEEVQKYKESPEGQGFWGARLIWTTLRSFDRGLIEASMRECVEAIKLYPDVIAGFDVVGQEDLGRSHRDLLPELLWFKEYCKEQGVDIPFFFHAGETLGDGDETDENLFDAILLGTKRIGHGFSLYKHPHLISILKSHNICLEICPISNEILRLTSSILSHSLPALLANGVPVSLNNDDPGILGQKSTGSMTHDYWQVLQAFDNVGLEGLGDLAETGVRFAAFEGVEVAVEEGVRAERLREWRGKWEAFCAWVVEEFGGEWPVDVEG